MTELDYLNSGKAESCRTLLLKCGHIWESTKDPRVLIKNTARATLCYLLDTRIIYKDLCENHHLLWSCISTEGRRLGAGVREDSLFYLMIKD